MAVASPAFELPAARLQLSNTASSRSEAPPLTADANMPTSAARLNPSGTALPTVVHVTPSALQDPTYVLPTLSRRSQFAPATLAEVKRSRLRSQSLDHENTH